MNRTVRCGQVCADTGVDNAARVAASASVTPAIRRLMIGMVVASPLQVAEA
jgi:hypothetical protein